MDPVNKNREDILRKRSTSLSNKELYSVIDIDAFEASVWTKKFPELADRPVLLRNHQRVTIAVNYLAKAFKVNRKDNDKTGKAKCPSLHIFDIPKCDGKSDQCYPCEQSYEIQECLRSFVNKKYPGITVTTMSRDEFYLEMSGVVDKLIADSPETLLNFSPHKKTKLIGNFETSKGNRLARAGMITEDIQQTIKCVTGYVASAGVSASCIVAKIACGNDKPDALTIVTDVGVELLYGQTDLQDAPGLKSKHGKLIVKGWKKPDGSDLKTLLDVQRYVSIQEVEEQLKLNQFQTTQLLEVSTGMDSKVLMDKRKGSLISSYKILPEHTSNEDVYIRQYILNCCVEIMLRVHWEFNLSPPF